VLKCNAPLKPSDDEIKRQPAHAGGRDAAYADVMNDLWVVHHVGFFI